MSNGKPCEAHNMPRDICARCVGAAQEQERILQLLSERMTHIESIAADMGEPEDVENWSNYPKSAFLEIERLIEVIKGNLPVKSDIK
jgi:hypothetical protein